MEGQVISRTVFTLHNIGDRQNRADEALVTAETNPSAIAFFPAKSITDWKQIYTGLGELFNSTKAQMSRISEYTSICLFTHISLLIIWPQNPVLHSVCFRLSPRKLNMADHDQYEHQTLIVTLGSDMGSVPTRGQLTPYVHGADFTDISSPAYLYTEL